MTKRRSRGRPKKVPEGQEWLRDLPAYLKSNLDPSKLEQEGMLQGLEDMRKGVIRQYGGFGITADMAYQLNDAQDPEISDQHRRKLLLDLYQKREKVRRGNLQGTRQTMDSAADRQANALQRHGDLIARLRANGHSEAAIAARIFKAEGVSLSTAKRWLRSKK